ncbi:MAG: ABC transporter ATP-binding protein [Actinomycetota bacterium]|nr:ABC transporter ATP-binding protein [Actinomycetota bacterium]
MWKRFRADRRRRLLRDEVQRIQAVVRGQRSRGWRWALREVNLHLEPGESVGLVGTNGSGKTTLLKLLARVMYPYAGDIQVAGRVGALIEVRAGIHPELTGRENVYITAALLGMSRKEVTRRFDDIVAFAELDEAIERQVKYYSSGMQMRLGFSIAAFLEPAVLLVDEVLAVGDATFQQKCLDRMGVMLGEGTTVVLVSHDLASVEATCTRGAWLRNGTIEADGPVREVLGLYRQSVEEQAESTTRVDGVVRLTQTEIIGPEEGTPRTQEPLEIRTVLESDDAHSARIFLGVSEGTATPIFVLRKDLQLTPGSTEARLTLPRLPLPRGRFFLWVGVFQVKGRDLLPWHPTAHFDVAGPELDDAPRAIVRLAPVHIESEWEVEKVDRDALSAR